VPDASTVHPLAQVAPGWQVQKLPPGLLGLFATKAGLLASVEAKLRLPVFAAKPLAVPLLHDGDPGHKLLIPVLLLKLALT
jgi:hypothetical protein